MRKILILTYFLITVFSLNSKAQDFWELVNIPDSINPSKLAFNSFGDVFMGSSNGVYKSEDEGETWIYYGLNNLVYNIIITEDDKIYAGRLSSLYRSSDNGDTWEHISMAGHGVSSFALDIYGNLLAGVRFNYSYIDYGVFRSYDYGILWDNLLPGHLVTSLAVDEFGGIYAGCDSDFGPSGVKYSENNGLSWISLNSGFHPNASITSLAISPENYIYATTYSPNHLYRSVNPIVSISEKSREQLDIKVFPNPFQDRINLHINKLNCNNEKLTIRIFNSLGQIIYYECKIYNILNNKFSINLNKYPSGLYYCSIRTETTEHNIKLIKK